VRLNAPLIAAVLATLLCLGVYWGHRTGAFRVPLLDRLDLDAIDAMFQIRGARAPADDRIVIVGLDERTRREAPRLFQLREEQAKLIDAIAALQPAAIGIDVLYSSPEINLPGAVVEEVRRAADALVAKLELKTPQEAAAEAALRSVIDAVSGDEKLAAAVARAGNVRLGV
jgi:CHASE2 domain-containing sensor protein